MNDLHFAVVIGINWYRPRFDDLTAAHNDAQDFYRWVTSTNGGNVPSKNAQLVIAELPPNPTAQQAEPTREAIHDALERFKELARKASSANWPRTRLYLYTAGHGIAPEEHDSALLAANADGYHLGRHVSCASLLEFFARVQLFREVVLFADCCRTSPRSDVKRMPVEWSDDDLDNGGVRRFLACGAIFGRKAFEDRDSPPDERRGFFTKALMDGLRGGAAAGQGQPGPITSTGLKNFISEHMRQATQGKFRTPLAPDFVDRGAGEVLFGAAGTLGGSVRHPVRIEIRSIAVTGVSVMSVEPGSAPEQVRSATNDPAAFECDLPVGFYEVVPIGAPVRPPGQEWLFKVVEGGGTHVF